MTQSRIAAIIADAEAADRAAGPCKPTRRGLYDDAITYDVRVGRRCVAVGYPYRRTADSVAAALQAAGVDAWVATAGY